MKSKQKLLFLDDSGNDKEVIQNLIDKSDISSDFTCVSNEQDYINELNSNRYDAIISGYSLSRLNSKKALELCKTHAEDTPFLILIDEFQEAESADLIREGAWDFVTKNNIQRLPLVLRKIKQEATFKRQKRKSEKLLEESYKRIESLISNYTGVVFRWTENEDKADFISEGSHDLCGFSSEEFLDEDGLLDWKDIIHPDDLYLVKWEHDQCYSLGQSYELEYRIISKYNGIRWVSESGSRSVDDKSGIKHIEGFISDVTDKKKNEDEIIHTILETEDKERRRIAKELHDSLGQTLSSALMNFRAFKKQIDNNIDSFHLFEKGLLQLMDAADESRNIAHNIMPKSIDDFGYVLTVESLLDDLKDSSKINFAFYNNLNDRVAGIDKELALFRITQECINNIIKHSKAKEATIQLIENETEYILTIEDDGVGFEKNELNHSFGLSSMKNRVSSLSGFFDIDSSKGKGTIVTVQMMKK